MSGALVLSGCTFSSGNDSSTEDGGTIVIAIQEDVRSPDNILEGGTTTDRLMMGSTVYEPLFGSGPNGELQPALAKEATPSEDLLTWTVKLQENVTFSNGKPFTAKDVAANFAAFQNPDNASSFRGDLRNLKGTTVVDDHTIEFHLEKPDRNFVAAMQETMFIADLDARGGKELLDPGDVPIGTGPYKWSSRVPGSSLTFVRNETYWRGRPPLDTVIFKVIPEGTAAVIALQRGEVDMITNYVPPQSLPSLRSDPDIEILTSVGNTYYHVFLNFEKERRGGYADGAAIREGFSYLMNTPEIVPPLIGDFGTLASQPVPPWQPGRSSKLDPYPFTYDAERGMALLEKGGIPRGGKIDMIALQDRPFLCQWATAVQSALRELGYDPQLQCIPSANAPPTFTQYEWDLLFYRNSGRATASLTYLQRWGPGVATPPTDTYTLQDDELQDIIDQMNLTADDAEYDALGAQAAERIVLEDIATIPGYFDTVYFPINKRVQGLVLSPLTWGGILYTERNIVTLADAT
jgi:peptide/nickel transport system substrate-binding protein